MAWLGCGAGGGKNDIPNRLKRQFAIFAVPQPSLTAINNIFGAVVKGRFGTGTPATASSHESDYINALAR